MICRDVSWDMWTGKDREEFDCDGDGDLDGVMVNQDEDVVMVAARNASRIDLQSKKKLSEYRATTTSKSDNSCCAIRLIRCMPISSTLALLP
jgi:hypothetical protein